MICRPPRRLQHSIDDDGAAVVCEEMYEDSQTRPSLVIPHPRNDERAVEIINQSIKEGGR